MECPFVFSSSAEIPVFFPREQCPLHMFSPEKTPAGPSIAWRFSGHSRKVTPLTLVCHKTPARHSFFFFSSPLRLSFSMYISSSCFIYIYIFFFFILSQNEFVLLFVLDLDLWPPNNILCPMHYIQAYFGYFSLVDMFKKFGLQSNFSRSRSYFVQLFISENMNQVWNLCDN